MTLILVLLSGVVAGGAFADDIDSEVTDAVCEDGYEEKNEHVRTINVNVPFSEDENSLSTKAIQVRKYSAEVGEVIEFRLSDSSGNSLSGTSVKIEWSTNNPEGISLQEDENDCSHCTLTILSFDHGKVSVIVKLLGFSFEYEFVHFEDVLESLFYSDSKDYTKRLALLSTELCDAANNMDKDNIESKIQEHGFQHWRTENYGSFFGLFATGSSAYALALKSFDEGKRTAIVIVARGTTSAAEIIGDINHGNPIDLPDVGQQIYNNIYEFEQIVWKGLEDFVSDQEIKTILDNSEDIALYITGHSLGGACASALTARLNHWIKTTCGSWLDKVEQGHMFAYTLGAIKVLPEEPGEVTPNIEDGNDNIHNIYNFFDTYGPNGRDAWRNISSVYAKFGHTDLFIKHFDEAAAPNHCENHLVGNYKDAIQNDLISGCFQKKVADKIDPFTQDFWLDGVKGTVDISFDSFWFTSNWYNHELCRFASKFAMLGYDQGDPTPDGNGKKMQNELYHALETIGFTFFEYNNHTGRDEVNYFIAKRKVNVHNREYDLVFMGLIGTYQSQWETDFDSGYNEYSSVVVPEVHEGFNNAFNYAYTKLKDYISINNLNSERTIVLLTGHSRGAAVANLLAAELTKAYFYTGCEKLCAKDKVFAYTFATPNVIKKSSSVENNHYEHIFNVVNPEDFVTKCMPAEWGYTRYGKTFVLPSSTNDKNYYKYDDTVEAYYQQYRNNGDEYQNYYLGEKDVYDIEKEITSSVTNAEEYYTKKFLTGGAFGATTDLHEFFVNNVAKAAGGNWGAGISLYTFSNNRNCDDLFQDIASFFIDNHFNRCFDDAHMSQTYCAFVSTLNGNELRQERKAYVGTANCPVDIEVYEKGTGELIGRIKDNVVDEEIAAKEKAVVMSVNGDSKSFWLPSNGNYEVKLIGNDNGTMDYTVAKIDSDTGETERVNFFDVPITKGAAWAGETASEGFDIADYTLTSESGAVLTHTESVDGEAARFSITTTAEGNGMVDGALSVVSGDYVTVRAVPDEGNSFAGWYENGTLVASEQEYAFVAKSDRDLTAKFIENQAETFKATFVADGVTVKVVEFARGATGIEEPPVPPKEGYTGRWSAYTLAESDIVITAIYEKNEEPPVEPENPTADASINVAGAKTIRYGTKVKITATAANLKEGYYLVLSVDGKEIKGTNTAVSFEYGELKRDVTYSVKIVDEKGNIMRDGSGQDLSQDGGKITCRAGFLNKLIAFLQKIFNMQPRVEVKPE